MLEPSGTSEATPLSGVYTAVPTPFGEDGRPDAGSLDALLEALLACRVSGFCVGGVTGEYPVCDVEDRLQLFRHVARRVADRVPLVFGIGAEHSRHIIKMAEVAKDLGAVAVLLPPASYFRFDPLDLVQIMQQVAESLPLPIILYHIPQFTNSLNASEVVAIVRSAEKIVGIKDSSGDRGTLEQFAAAKQSTPFILMAGSDDLFLAGLELSADGAISGLSCIVPELMIGIYDSFKKGDTKRALVLQGLVQELAAAVSELPTPWRIKIALETQGFHMGPLSWPRSSRMGARAVAFHEWFQKWAPAVRERLVD
ncbi:MAG TPA: dihydrodipicolinate synthase family protein [Terriglobales bacterium]|nr:dihydrodipicolinate synthase family protein [Terriglobales bacterium]